MEFNILILLYYAFPREKYKMTRLNFTLKSYIIVYQPIMVIIIITCDNVCLS